MAQPDDEFAQYKALAELVFQVRKAQREYFKARTKEALIASKRLEAALDLRLGQLGYR